jgi:type IV pilus assembly protein PilM
LFGDIAAFDIGSTSIKLIKAKSGFRDFQVKSFDYKECTDDSNSMNEILSGIIGDENLQGYKIISNLPMEKTIIRNISFPFSDVEKIAEAIPFEAEEHIPFKLDDMILDFQPMKSSKENEGRILLAAAHKDNVYDFLKLFEEMNIKPVMLGLESTSLFECYRYFNTIENESVIQLDIGNNKTIMNIIDSNSLIYTRSISTGIGEVIKSISEILKISMPESSKVYESLYLDLRSFENNTKKDFYKNYKISRTNLQKIYKTAVVFSDELIEQVLLTLKSFSVENGEITFSRILISGGGSNLTGLQAKLTSDIDIPVFPLPFMTDNRDQRVKSQFPIAFGLLVSFLKNRKNSINFLKGEFLPDVAGSSYKIYYLAGFFAILGVSVLIINLISSFLLTIGTNKNYRETMDYQFKKYFQTKPLTNDPISEAKKIVFKEKKELEVIDNLMSDNEPILDILSMIAGQFPGDEAFDMKSLVVNERIIRIDASISSAKKIDDFKDRLNQTKKFESVSVTIKNSKKNEVIFSMNIKLKQRTTTAVVK